VLVHVIDPIGYAFPTGGPSALSVDQPARAELNRVEEQLRAQGISVHSVVETGDICELILQTVRDHGGDLLVLGTRGKTAVGRAGLGAIACQLLAKTEVPILTVTPDVEVLIPWAAGKWRTVLLATDFSTCSLAALTAAHRIAHGLLTVLHSSVTESDTEHRGHLEQLRFLAPMKESHTVPVEHIVTTGEAGQVMVDFVLKHQIDLVVLGNLATMLSEEDMHTSTVLQVISGVHCPVLCIPAPRERGKSTTPAIESEREETAATAESFPCSMDGKRLKLHDEADAPWVGQSVTSEGVASLLQCLENQPGWGGCQPSSGREIPGQRWMLSIA
jgi:nucleotide-binding universal stress UspA family protein